MSISIALCGNKFFFFSSRVPQQMQLAVIAAATSCFASVPLLTATRIRSYIGLRLPYFTTLHVHCETVILTAQFQLYT